MSLRQKTAVLLTKPVKSELSSAHVSHSNYGRKIKAKADRTCGTSYDATYDDS
jgi:hypothetical protein